MRTCNAAVPTCGQEIDQVGARDIQGRKHARKQAGKDRQSQSKKQHAHIEGSLPEAWDIAWVEERKEAKKEKCKCDAGTPGQDANKQSLRQQLANNATATATFTKAGNFDLIQIATNTGTPIS